MRYDNFRVCRRCAAILAIDDDLFEEPMLITRVKQWWEYNIAFQMYRYLFAADWTWRKVWCRYRGHPHGAIFYNPGGTEPNDRCIDCGDHLG